MVRLRVKVNPLARYICGFQFQYGTIERKKASVQLEEIIEFQFQYGTIESHH